MAKYTIRDWDETRAAFGTSIMVNTALSSLAQNLDGPDWPLKGKDETPTAIGPNLTDTKWIHGGKPSEAYDTITKGVLSKGMPAWGPVLGQKRITEAIAYIYSLHREGEPIEIVPSAPLTPPAP